MGFKRRGQGYQLWWVIDIILFASLILMMIFVVNDIIKNTKFERKYMAKDIALAVNNLYASPNDLVFFYVETEFPFAVRFEKNKVMVIDPTTGEVTAEEHLFIEDTNIGFEYGLISPITTKRFGTQIKYVLPLGFKKTSTSIIPFVVKESSSVEPGTIITSK